MTLTVLNVLINEWTGNEWSNDYIWIHLFTSYISHHSYIQNASHLYTIEETAYYSAPSEADEKLRQSSLMSEFRNEAQLNIVLIIPQYISHDRRFYKPALKYRSFHEIAECNKELLYSQALITIFNCSIKLTWIHSKIYGPLGRLCLLMKAL